MLKDLVKLLLFLLLLLHTMEMCCYGSHYFMQTEILYGVAQVIQISQKTCTCCRFQDTGVPCGHAIAVIYKQNVAPASYMPNYLKMATYREAYTQDLPVILLSNVIDVKKASDRAQAAANARFEGAGEEQESGDSLSDVPLVLH